MTRRLIAASIALLTTLVTLGLLAPAASAAVTDYRHLGTSAGAPVAWACGSQAVWLYRPPTARHTEIIREALAEVSSLTGVQLTIAGNTQVSPWRAKASDPRIIIGFDKFDAAYAGWARHEQRGAEWVRGRVTLNTAVTYVANPKTEKDWAHYENTVLHEIGHLVGLDHVDAKAEVMFSKWNTGRTTYGRGDRAGLTALGCRKTPMAASIPGRYTFQEGLVARTAPSV